jgi:phosphoribosylanthranilate isomerase
MKIKICGIWREEDAGIVNKVLPDYAGFVFYKKSRRFVETETAGKLRGMIDGRVVTVGVFVNAEIETVAEIVNRGIVSAVQLHGDENEEYIACLKKSVPRGTVVIKAVQPDCDKIYDTDFYLLDNVKAGSGTAFDWSGIRSYDKPFFLAGGINLSNIAEAVRLNCFAVDISSGAEIDGKKDAGLTERLVKFVRNFDLQNNKVQ